MEAHTNPSGSTKTTSKLSPMLVSWSLTKDRSNVPFAEILLNIK